MPLRERAKKTVVRLLLSGLERALIKVIDSEGKKTPFRPS
jgi:hypothetical protein